MKTALFVLTSFLCSTAFCQNTIHVMFYNLYRFPVQPPARRENILKEILDTYRPDLLMVSELVNEEGAYRILDSALNHNGASKYASALFVPMQSEATDPLQQLVFYNKERFTLLQQQTYPTKVRDINHYTFLLNTAGDSVYLHAFVVHLKSSEGPANRQLRLEMTDTFVKKLETLPADHYVLLAGDFNFYSSYSEPAYQRMLDTANAIPMVDPTYMPGKWSNNDTFSAIHTQATRLSTDGFGQGGASGGMDDRFDFIMMSANLEANDDLRYVAGSYKAYGNNGNCFDNRVDAYDCEGPYPLALRQHLHNMSDHLPVVMQLRTNKDFLVGIDEAPAPAEVALPNGNMVRDFLTLNIINGRSFRKESFCIYNNLGQQLNANIIVSGNTARLDLRHFKAGLYYIRYGEKIASTIKITKLP